MHGRLGRRRRPTAEPDVRTAGHLQILDHEGMVASLQRDLEWIDCSTTRVPLIHHELPVYPDMAAVIDGHGVGVCARLQEYVTYPACGEAIGRDACTGRALSPVEIHLSIDPASAAGPLRSGLA